MPNENQPMVCIRTFGSRSEAEIARSTLESAGIHAAVAADDCGGMLSMGRDAKLMVLADHAERAEAVLQQAVESTDE